MVLSNFSSRVPEDLSHEIMDNDSHETIQIFHMLNILKEMYYLIHVPEIEKYIIQTRTANEASRVKLPDVHGREKWCKSIFKARKASS